MEPFAEAAGMDPYDARLALQIERPRLLRKVETATEAADLSARLASARIAHFTLAEADVISIEIVPVRNMAFMEEELHLGLAGGKLQVTRYRDLAFLVRGDIARERHRERGLGTVQGTNHSLTPGLRLHFFPKKAAAVYELDPEQFDWSLLGSEAVFVDAAKLPATAGQDQRKGTPCRDRSRVRWGTGRAFPCRAGGGD